MSQAAISECVLVLILTCAASCWQEAAESVHEVARGLQAMRQHVTRAPPAVQLTLTAANREGPVTVTLHRDGYRDLLSSTIQVRNEASRSHDGTW